MTLWEMLEKSKENLEKLNIEDPTTKAGSATSGQTEGNTQSASTGMATGGSTGSEQSQTDLTGLTELQKAIAELQKNMQAIQSSNLAANNHNKEVKNDSFINILHNEDYYKDIIKSKGEK